MKLNLKSLVLKIDRHEIFVMSGALAYSTALALAPFILIILSLLSFLDPAVQNKFINELGNSLGSEVGATIQTIVTNVNSHPQLSGISSIIGFAILLISASAIFSQLKIAIDKINEYTVNEDSNGIFVYFKDKFLSLGLVLGFSFLSIVSLMVTIFITIMYPENDAIYWQAFISFITFLLFVFLFTCIFRFVPSTQLQWRKCFSAGTVSTFFYLIGKSLISLYLEKAGLGSLYGAAGSLIVFLVWVYYTSLTLLLSYEVSLHYMGKPTPHEKKLTNTST